MPPMKVSAMATSTGDWLSRAMVVGGALTAIDILLPPSRTDQYCNHKSKSRRRFMPASARGRGQRAGAARAAPLSGAAVVIIPDPRGVPPFYKDLVRRFAQAGVDAVAVDYLSRTAGMSERGNDFDYRAHIGQTKPETIAADVAAGIAHLRSPAGSRG